MDKYSSSIKNDAAAPFEKNVDHIEDNHVVNLSDIDARLQEMSKECPPFCKNYNQLILYLLIIPGCLVPSITLGFDSAMVNGLQAVPASDNCEVSFPHFSSHLL